LVLAACCFVAAKVEETPVHIKSVVSEGKVVFAGESGDFGIWEALKIGSMSYLNCGQIQMIAVWREELLRFGVGRVYQ